MDYILDTNVLLLYIRKNKYAEYVDRKYSPMISGNTIILSVVSVGEIKSIARQNKWGKKKMETLSQFLNKFIIADINVLQIVDRYAEIDAYSQGKLENQSTKFTAKNMGKNDLWIAATASVLNVKFLTTDKDFSHLDKKYLDLELVELSL